MYTVIYRTGGTANFEWHRILDYGTYEAMLPHRNEIRRAGRLAFVHPLLDDMPTEFNFGGNEPKQFVASHRGRLFVCQIVRSGKTDRIIGIGYTNDLTDALRLSYAETVETANAASMRNHARVFVVESFDEAYARLFTRKETTDA